MFKAELGWRELKAMFSFYSSSPSTFLSSVTSDSQITGFPPSFFFLLSAELNENRWGLERNGLFYIDEVTPHVPCGHADTLTQPLIRYSVSTSELQCKHHIHRQTCETIYMQRQSAINYSKHLDSAAAIVLKCLNKPD